MSGYTLHYNKEVASILKMNRSGVYKSANSCGNKQQFKSKEKAKNFIEKNLVGNKRTIYKCKFCEYYHIARIKEGVKNVKI